MESNQSRSYWRSNLRVVTVLLSVWFIIAYVCSILLIDWLNQFQVGELGLGFWIAQQGSIFVFIALVLIYALWMDRLDRKFESGE